MFNTSTYFQKASKTSKIRSQGTSFCQTFYLTEDTNLKGPD